LQQQEHTVFKRDGPNLHIKKSITLQEALTGFTFTVKHLDERTLVIRSERGEVVKPSEHKVIRGQGMPSVKNPFIKGDLFIEFDVQFPESGTLTEQQLQSLSTALPQPVVDMDVADAEDALKAQSEHHEEVTMEGQVNISEERRRAAHVQRSEFEEDQDEDEDPRQHTAQCRQS
jgi:DnaJ family protein A protein 2